MNAKTCFGYGFAFWVTTLLTPHVVLAQYSNYYLPIEKGFLDSHIDLQYQYAKFPQPTKGADIEGHGSIVSIEGQYVFSDRFEAGLNVPFLVHGAATVNGFGSSETQFGDIFLNLKGKVLGNDTLSLAAFVNTRLPTHSGDDPRENASVIPGVAASFGLLGIEINGAVKALWEIEGETSDVVFLGLDAGAGYSLLGILTLNLGMQYVNSLKPSSEWNVLAFVPGVGVDVLDIVHLGLAARIATTDESKSFFKGRVNVLFHGGIRF